MHGRVFSLHTSTGALCWGGAVIQETRGDRYLFVSNAWG